MKKSSIFVAHLFLPFLCLAQFQNNNWPLGGISVGSNTNENAVKIIDFRSSPHALLTVPNDRVFKMYEGGSIINTKEGELLFYTNGIDIYNAGHKLVEDGGNLPTNLDLIGSVFRTPQGSLFLPMPGHKDSVVLIHTEAAAFTFPNGDFIGGSPLVTYTLIDKSANNGEGKVVKRLIPMIRDTLVGGQNSACRHANGRDWWLLNAEYQTNRWYRTLITPDGFENQQTQSFPEKVVESAGFSKFSPDGSFFARINESWVPSGLYLDVYNFDRCSGSLSNHEHVKVSTIGKPGGLAFSPNSRFMYVTAWDTIYQYDMQALDWQESKEIVAVYDGFEADILAGPNTLLKATRFYMMALAPDGKIYISVPNTNHRFLHTIESPDSLGIACDIRQHSYEFTTPYNYGLPNFPHYLGALEGSPCDTLATVSSTQSSPKEVDFNIFPNPTAGLIHYKSSKASSEFSIYSTLGQLVFSKKINSREVEISIIHLPDGLYYYRILSNGRIEKTGELVKME